MADFQVRMEGQDNVYRIFHAHMEYNKRAETDLYNTVKAIALPRLKYKVKKGPTGNLQKGVRVRHLKERQGEIAAVEVGIYAPHAHLLIGGVKPHAIYSPEGKVLKWKGKSGEKVFRHDAWHPGIQGKPFVRMAVFGLEGLIAADLVKKLELQLK